MGATGAKPGPFAQAPQKGAVPQLPPQTPAGAGGAQPRFTGHPVTLDFQGADLRTVLRTFADISGLNIVIDQSVQGAVDVSLHEVPWDQALDIILRDHKLGYSVEGTIVRIAPLTVLADEEAQRRKLAEERALSGDLEVLTRPLSYAKATRADAAADAHRAVAARRHPDRRADQHHHHSRSGEPAPGRGAADRHARPSAAAGRNRSAHRHDDARLRPPHRRAVGHERPHGAGHRQHDEPGVSQSDRHRRAGRAARKGRRSARRRITPRPP